MNEILWTYTGENFIDGVPARDLTQQDWGRLDADLRAAVENLGLYRRVKTAAAVAVEQPPKETKAASKGADSAKE